MPKQDFAMSRDANCIFCKIVAKEISAAVIHEDSAVVSFLDIGPLAEGHLLVIPRDHYGRLTDVSPDVCARIGSVLPVLGRALLTVTGASAFNALCNEGQAAGQLVSHVHFHLIPRRSGDALGYRWNAGTYAEGRAAELAAAYQRALAQHH